MMNKAKLKAFRDWFAEHTAPYSQRDCTHCLAGHAVRWEYGTVPDVVAFTVLVEIFGVSRNVATLMYNHPTHWSPTKDDALAMLDKLIETGKVEWPA